MGDGLTGEDIVVSSMRFVLFFFWTRGEIKCGAFTGRVDSRAKAWMWLFS
jgi:hypothetical protein